MSKASSTYRSHVKLYRVGDLVKFTGYNYTPDYIIIDDYGSTIGIVVNVTKVGYVEAYYSYTVYWFNLKRFTEVIGDHLILVSK